MKKFDLTLLKNKNNKIVSSREALKDTVPFDWDDVKDEKKVIGNMNKIV